MRGDNHMQRATLRGFLFLIIASLLVGSAYAANDTVSSYVINDQPYTPYPVFVVTLSLGLLFLILSLVLSGDQNNDAFAALSIIPLFAAAWMANQLAFSMGGAVGTVSDSVFRVNYQVYPATVLAVIIFLLGVVAIFQFYRLLTGEKVEGYQETRPQQQYQDDE